ncbi:GIY-YIG nuclease family protein [Acinetobacter baumannii]|uniref:GIY-YIG nuclease family protein n=1 Tax=Acinetobacter baumannii TaxID=470 RepID=UPI003D315EC7
MGNKYNIRNTTLNCNSSNIVYLLNCKVCHAQYVGSCTTKFRLRFNNYKSCNKSHTQKIVPQQSLHDHFDQPGHSGFTDWEFILIDQGNSEMSVRKRERFWQYTLNTFLPNGLNDCTYIISDDLYLSF